ncbi:MAG: carbohydrate kinase family protein, partial [Chloroflexota bacterium]
GHRTMFGYIGASRNLGPQDVPDEAICQAQVVHLTGYSLLAESRRRAFERAITLARQAGVPLSLDPGLATCCQARELLYAVLPEMTLVLLDRKEAGHLVQTDEPRAVIEALQATGVAWVGVKCGAEGCWLAGPDGHNHWLPAFSVGVQDTTGAGDAFDAGVLFGYLRQLGPAAMALLGNALGALACTVWGIGCAMPGRDAVRRLLQEARASEPWVQWQPIIDQTLHALTSQ